jgi:Bifunctional DNA primase/polymerase, N-terminal
MQQVFLEGRPLHIFPCDLNKKPTIKNWHNAAVPDQPGIAALWLRRPGLLIGVPTGVINGIDIVDIDPRNGGDAWLDANRERLPVTRTHRTRSGGLHFIFKHALGQRGRVIAPGVDLKSTGGLVIWWPASSYEVLNPGPVAPFPEWLIDIKGGQCTRLGLESNSYPNREQGCAGVERTQNLARRTERILRKVELAKPGNRNAMLYWAACRFAEIVAEGRLKPEVAEKLLRSAAQMCGLVRDDGAEQVTATIASGFRNAS